MPVTISEAPGAMRVVVKKTKRNKVISPDIPRPLSNKCFSAIVAGAPNSLHVCKVGTARMRLDLAGPYLGQAGRAAAPSSGHFETCGLEVDEFSSWTTQFANNPN